MTTFLIVVGALVYVACVIAWVLHRLRRSRRPALILTPDLHGLVTKHRPPGESIRNRDRRLGLEEPESLVIYTRADMNPNLWERTGQSSFGKPGWRRKRLDSAAPYKIEPPRSAMGVINEIIAQDLERRTR